MNKFLELAIKESKSGLKSKAGGPFGAVIVKNSKVIASAHNLVLKTCDPTAHAEISAIRKASKKLKTFDLTGCEIYITAMPCPMCLFAIHWANIKNIYYSATSSDIEKIGFRDKNFYDIIKNKKKSKLKIKRLKSKEVEDLLKSYKLDKNKRLY